MLTEAAGTGSVDKEVQAGVNLLENVGDDVRVDSVFSGWCEEDVAGDYESRNLEEAEDDREEEDQAGSVPALVTSGRPGRGPLVRHVGGRVLASAAVAPDDIEAMPERKRCYGDDYDRYAGLEHEESIGLKVLEHYIPA